MHAAPCGISRRSFVHTGVLAAAGVSLSPYLRAEEKTNPAPLFSSVGIAASLDKAADLKAAGAQFLTESVGSFLVPDKPDDMFARNLEKLAASPLPILACNSFIRAANLRCVGKDATHDNVLEWAATAFKRLKQAKGKFIVFGSGSSRQLRDGWPKGKADEQFVALLKRMGPLAEKQGVTVVVEQLQERECNYINHLAEGAALIRAAGHPNVRLLADLYHMARMGDTPADLDAAMDVVVHVEIAEKEGRTVPGVAGDDFRPFFRVLRKRGYNAALNVEAKWEPSQLAGAFREIQKQVADV